MVLVSDTIESDFNVYDGWWTHVDEFRILF